MATVKTNISLQESLVSQVEDLAHDLKLSRSEVVALALEEFVQRHHNRQLLDSTDRAYETLPDADEPARMPALRQHHRRVVEGEW